MRMSRGYLDKVIAVMQQRADLDRADHVMQQKIAASEEQEALLNQQSNEVRDEGMRLSEQLDGRGSENLSWTSEDAAVRDRMLSMKRKSARAGLLRCKLDVERHVWRHALLEKHRAVHAAQMEADKELRQHLQKENLLNFSENLALKLRSRKLLPLRNRETREMMKKFQESGILPDRSPTEEGARSETTPWTPYHRDEERYDKAYLTYLETEQDLKRARKAFKEYALQTDAIEEKYRFEFLAGQDVPSP